MYRISAICVNQMGARISGIGSNILYIDGVKKLGGTDFTIGSDFMEVGSYIGPYAVTRGELEIANAGPKNLRMTKIVLRQTGYPLGYRRKHHIRPLGSGTESIPRNRRDDP